MTYSTGGLIQATDYNNFVSGIGGNVNAVWNTTYNQGTVSNVTVATAVTASRWTQLNNTITSMAGHQGTTVTTRTNPAAGETISVMPNVGTDIASCFANRLNAIASAAQFVAWTGSVSRTSSVKTSDMPLIFTSTVTFASAAAANGFFGAGGRIQIQMGKSSFNSENTADTSWNAFIGAAGAGAVVPTNIWLTSDGVSKTIAGATYTGTTVDAGPTGAVTATTSFSGGGGGGSGAVRSTNTVAGVGRAGGTGGLYGGGGGGGGSATTASLYTTGNGGSGAQGAIIIRYTPVSGVLTTVILTSGTTWTVPANWNNTSNTIDAISGGGGGGKPSIDSFGAGGGGGGGFSRVTNFVLTPGQTVRYSIGAGGAGKTTSQGDGSDGGTTWLNKTTNAAPTSSADGVRANGGAGGDSGGTGGVGGTTVLAVGTTVFAGGNGGGSVVDVTSTGGAGGGGGSAGTASGNGFSGTTTTGRNGGGGGGTGGAATSGVGGIGITGAAGGAVGGNSSNGSSGTSGSGGGGGGDSQTSGTNGAGGDGGTGFNVPTSTTSTATGFNQLTTSLVTLYSITVGTLSCIVQASKSTSGVLTIRTSWNDTTNRDMSGGIAATNTGGVITWGTAPTVIVTYYAPSTTYLTNTWGTPTIASTVTLVGG